MTSTSLISSVSSSPSTMSNIKPHIYHLKASKALKRHFFPMMDHREASILVTREYVICFNTQTMLMQMTHRTYDCRRNINTVFSAESNTAGSSYTRPCLDSQHIFLPTSFHAPTTQSKESPGQNSKLRLMLLNSSWASWKYVNVKNWRLDGSFETPGAPQQQKQLKCSTELEE